MDNIYKTIKFTCSDCGKKGLVLRQISILNLAFWLLLGIGTMFLMRLLDLSWVVSGFTGFFVWYISTAINVKKNKPQCRHCFSHNVTMPEKASVEADRGEPDKEDEFKEGNSKVS